MAEVQNKLKFFNDYIEISCDRSDTESLFLAGQIPYVHRNKESAKTAVFKTTIRNIDLVLKLFRNIDESTVAAKLPFTILNLYNKEIQRRCDTEQLLLHGPEREHEFLWKNQRLGLELAEVNSRFGFFYDTRTGKTPMSLAIMNEDIKHNPAHKWLVLCPLILIKNAWLEDAHMFPDIKVISLHASTKEQRHALMRQKANVYVSNIESFASYRKDFEAMGFHGVIVDESSTMKSNSSKFGLEAVEFASTVKRWYLLSGTPAPNGEWEYYRQLQSIDFFGVHKSYSQFKEYFFNNTSRNPQYEKLQLRQDRKDELLSLLRKYSLYVDQSQAIRTPGRTFHEVTFDLPYELKQNYNILKRDLSLEITEDTNIVAQSSAANLNKLNQITSGFVIDTAAMVHNRMLRSEGIKEGYKQEDHLFSMYRFEKLKELLDSFGDKQVLIWAYYRKEFDIIKELLGNKCACVYGGMDINEKNANITAFKSGKIQWLVANPASADKGLTLTNAHIAVYFSMSYSYELFKQSKERIYGDVIKQPEHCHYYVFIANGTVDSVIYKTVTTKGNMSMEVLNHLKGGDL